MRKLGRALAVVAIVAASVLVVPSSASAIDALPPPVAEVPDTASRIVKVVGTGTAIGDETAVRAAQIWKAYLDYVKTLQTPPVIPPEAPPVVTPPAKPVTAPKPFMRGVAPGTAGASLLTAFQGGWAIGQGGLQLYGMISGTDQQKLMCQNAPEWFNAINGFMTFGLASNCAAAVELANADIERWSGASFQGYTIGAPVGRLGDGSYCFPISWPANNGGSAFIPNSNPRVQIYALQSDGRWVGWNITTPTGTSWCKSAFKVDLAHSTTMALGLGPVGASAPTSRVVENDTNPNRQPSCSISWSDGTTTTGLGQAYRESNGLPMSSEGLGCKSAWDAKPGAGLDYMPSRIKVDSDEGGSKTTISDQEVPAFSPTDLLPLDPNLGNGRGLVLEKVSDGVTVSCMTWEADCAQWWEQTQQGTQPNVGTSVYRCTYGGQVIDLLECGPYRHTFDTKTSTPTITDPSTGEQVPWISENSLNSTSPDSVPRPGDQCMSSWPATPNPIEWVAHPVKCALVAAFVPRPAVVDASKAQIQAAWNASSFGGLVLAATGLVNLFETEQGCEGLPFEINFFGTMFRDRLFAACSEPWAGVAAVFRNIISGVLFVGGFLAILRYGAGVFGFVGLGLGLGDRDSSSGSVRFK